MSSVPDSKSNSLLRIQSIILPAIRNADTGPIHTIVQDEAGNLYYSDEINHSVVSLGAEGTMRWCKTAHGSLPGEFYYPRGISLGWVLVEGQPTRCLAVCDAWNRRIQMLDLSGELLGMWSGEGEETFSEPVDIRFIKRAAIAGNGDDAGFWRVLDKGRHALYEMSLNGSMRSKSGRCFPPNLERNWTLTEIHFEKGTSGTRCLEDMPPFDFLYYPERILGESCEPLCVWEPFSRRMKLAHNGNFFPVHINKEENLEWIAADSGALVGWNRECSQLSLFDHWGRLLDRAPIYGTPVISNLPLSELFVQNGKLLEKWTWTTGARQGSLSIESSGTKTLLIRTAQAELSRLNIKLVREALDALLVRVDEQLSELGDMLSLSDANPDSYPYQRALWYLPRAPVWRAPLERAFRESIQPWCLFMLEYCALGPVMEDQAPNLEQAETDWKEMATKARQRRDAMYQRRDQIAELKIRLMHKTGDGERSENWERLVTAAEPDLEAVLIWLEGCCGKREESRKEADIRP
jgi:hypothetical protein